MKNTFSRTAGTVVLFSPSSFITPVKIKSVLQALLFPGERLTTEVKRYIFMGLFYGGVIFMENLQVIDIIKGADSHAMCPDPV